MSTIFFANDVLQSVALSCSTLQLRRKDNLAHILLMICVAVCCSALQCVTACCSVLQCAALCCSVLQSVVQFCACSDATI